MGISSVGRIPPCGIALEKTPPRRLVGREYGEFYSLLRQKQKGSPVNSRFGQPHSLGTPAEAVFEITNPPADLGQLVPLICQGHYDMVIDLRYGVAVAPERLHALAVGVQNGLVNPGIVAFEPVHQGGTEIEAEIPVIVHQIENSILVVDKAGRRVCPVAFEVDAFVPVMIRAGGILTLDFLDPGIFAWRLVEVSVNANIFFFRWILHLVLV